jgi:hypothetical protein
MAEEFKPEEVENDLKNNAEEIGSVAEASAETSRSENVKLQTEKVNAEDFKKIKDTINNAGEKVVKTTMNRLNGGKMNETKVSEAVSDFTTSVDEANSLMDEISKNPAVDHAESMEKLNKIKEDLTKKYGNLEQANKTIRKLCKDNFLKQIKNSISPKLSDKLAKSADAIEKLNDAAEKNGFKTEDLKKLLEKVNESYSDLANPNDPEAVKGAASLGEKGWDTWKKIVLGIVILGGIGSLFVYGLLFSHKMSGCQQLTIGGVQSVLNCYDDGDKADYYEKNQSQCACGSLTAPLNKNRTPTTDECKDTNEVNRPYCGKCGSILPLCTEGNSHDDGAIVYFYQYHSMWEGMGSGIGDLLKGFSKGSGITDFLQNIGQYLKYAFYLIAAMIAVYFVVSLAKGSRGSSAPIQPE